MESTSSDRWSNRPRRTATHERRVPSNIPPSPAPLSSTMKRLPASTLSGNHRLSALQLQPQPTPPDPGLSDDPPSPQQHWQRVLDRPLKTLSGLHTHQGPQLILPASVLTTAIGATERQLRKPGDPTMQAAGERQLQALQQDQQALAQLAAHLVAIHVRLQTEAEPLRSDLADRLGGWTIGQMLTFIRDPQLHLDLLLQALRQSLSLSDLQTLVRAGLTVDRIGHILPPDDTSRAVQRMTRLPDALGTSPLGAERLCLRSDDGVLHHFLFVPCTPNGPVAQQIRKGVCLQRLQAYLGLRVMPDIHPHIHPPAHGSGDRPVYGMLIGCHDSHQTSTGATADVDPRHPATLRQYLELEWMAYLCELRIRPDQLTWVHGPDGARLCPTQPMEGLPSDLSTQHEPLRFVGLGMPQLITDDLAHRLEGLTEADLKSVVGPFLTHGEYTWLCNRVRRVQTAVMGSFSDVRRLTDPLAWSDRETLRTLGLEGTTDRLQRHQSGQDNQATVLREAEGYSLPAWHELSCALQHLAPTVQPSTEPATPRASSGPKLQPEHVLATSGPARSWAQRVQALGSPGSLGALPALATTCDQALAMPPAAPGDLPAMARRWTAMQTSGLELLLALQRRVPTLPPEAAREAARLVRLLQNPSMAGDALQEQGPHTEPGRQHHQALAEPGAQPAGTSEEQWLRLTSLVKSYELRLVQPLLCAPPGPAWLDLPTIDTLAAWARRLTSELDKLVGSLDSQQQATPLAVEVLRLQTKQDLAQIDVAMVLARQLNGLMPPTQSQPLSTDALLALAHLPGLGGADIAPALAAGCSVADIVQASRAGLSMTTLAAAALAVGTTGVDAVVRSQLPLARLAAELQNSAAGQSWPRPVPAEPMQRQRLDNQIDWNTDALGGEDPALTAASVAATGHEQWRTSLGGLTAAELDARSADLHAARRSLEELDARLAHLARERPNQSAAQLLTGRLMDQVRTEQAGLLRLRAFMDRLRHRLSPAALVRLPVQDLLPLVQQPDLQPDYLVQGLLAGWTPGQVLQAHHQALPVWAIPLTGQLK